MIAIEPKDDDGLRRKVILTAALFFVGVGGFLLAGYLALALLSL
jgi:hypothetical protein